MPQNATASKKDSGQVLVEYLLMLSLSISLLILMQKTFRASLYTLWTGLGKEISAGCPQGCLPDPTIH